MSSPASTSAFHAVAPFEGDPIWFNGALQNVKLPGEWSDDALSLVEVSSTAGRATGLHTDPSHETFYVLEGELLFHVDGVEHAAGAGDTVSVRKGTPHAFVATSELAKFIVLNTPGTQDGFFRDGGEPATHQDFESAPAPDRERMDASCRKHGIEMLGPPPFSALGVAG